MDETIVLRKNNNHYVAVTEDARVKDGDLVEVKKKVTQDALEIYKMYWGGLIPLILPMWTPASVLMTENEISLMKYFHGWARSKGIEIKGHDIKEFMKTVCEKRANKVIIPAPNAQSLHREIKMQTGFVQTYPSGRGYATEPMSMSITGMSVKRRKEFYQSAKEYCFGLYAENFGNNMANLDNEISNRMNNK